MPHGDRELTATAAREGGDGGGAGGRRGDGRGAGAALVAALAVMAAGLAAGALLFFLERALVVRPLTAQRSDGGWVVEARGRRGFAGLAGHGERLLWQYGATIECLDLRDGKLRILGPGAGQRATWPPAVGERYAVWFEAPRATAEGAMAVVYDAGRGRRRPLARLRGVYSPPSVSGATAVWCEGGGGRPQLVAVSLVGAPRRTVVADGYGTPQLAGDLVVWSQGERGPLLARRLGDTVTWSVTAPGLGGRLAGWALAGRTVVCAVVAGAGAAPAGAAPAPATILAVPVDGGPARVLARDVPLLAGPAAGGGLAAWAARDAGGGSRVVVRRLDLAPPRTVAVVAGEVTGVAVAGRWVAFLVRGRQGWRLEAREVAP